jgi:NADH-quinone oxidoreductase subunit D
VFFVVERICGICSTSHPFAYANAMEEIAGIEIPDRAKYIRSIIGELERIHSHLLWVGLAGHFLDIIPFTCGHEIQGIGT